MNINVAYDSYKEATGISQNILLQNFSFIERLSRMSNGYLA